MDRVLAVSACEAWRTPKRAFVRCCNLGYRRVYSSTLVLWRQGYDQLIATSAGIAAVALPASTRHPRLRVTYEA